MPTEFQAIAELFRDPRKVQRREPLKQIISKTYGSGDPMGGYQYDPGGYYPPMPTFPPGFDFGGGFK
jgi:hypothetical protein